MENFKKLYELCDFVVDDCAKFTNRKHDMHESVKANINYNLEQIRKLVMDKAPDSTFFQIGYSVYDTLIVYTTFIFTSEKNNSMIEKLHNKLDGKMLIVKILSEAGE